MIFWSILSQNFLYHLSQVPCLKEAIAYGLFQKISTIGHLQHVEPLCLLCKQKLLHAHSWSNWEKTLHETCWSSPPLLNSEDTNTNKTMFEVQNSTKENKKFQQTRRYILQNEDKHLYDDVIEPKFLHNFSSPFTNKLIISQRFFSTNQKHLLL